MMMYEMTGMSLELDRALEHGLRNKRMLEKGTSILLIYPAIRNASSMAKAADSICMSKSKLEREIDQLNLTAQDFRELNVDQLFEKSGIASYVLEHIRRRREDLIAEQVASNFVSPPTKSDG